MALTKQLSVEKLAIHVTDDSPLAQLTGNNRPRLSISSAFSGATVLVTGATGYIGSLLVEQILRCCPDVRRVYVLIRGKGGKSVSFRLKRLLYSGLFNKVRGNPSLIAKVVAVEGDITSPGLGLSGADLSTLQNETNIILHCAADITLDPAVKVTLKRNYLSTDELLQMATTMPHLQVFVHVSSAYVNANLPHNSAVEERLYPLHWGCDPVRPEVVVHELMNMADKDAELKATTYMNMWNFPNPYAFGKHLTEQLVCQYHHKHFPVVIVRPSFVGALWGDPYPGYVGNYAGPTGYSLALGLGFANKGSLRWSPYHFVDFIPGDICSSIILASAAAAVSGLLSTDPHQPPAIVHATTTSTFPLANIEGYRISRKFFKAAPLPVTFLPQGMMKETFNYQFTPLRSNIAVGLTRFKVKCAAGMLKLMGKRKLAKKLTVGFAQWSYANHPEHDFNIFFSSRTALWLESVLDPSESHLFPLVWSAEKGTWQEYYNTYLAAISRMMFNREVDPKKVTHGFHYIADMRVEDDKSQGRS